MNAGCVSCSCVRGCFPMPGGITQRGAGASPLPSQQQPLAHPPQVWGRRDSLEAIRQSTTSLTHAGLRGAQDPHRGLVLMGRAHREAPCPRLPRPPGRVLGNKLCGGKATGHIPMAVMFSRPTKGCAPPLPWRVLYYTSTTPFPASSKPFCVGSPRGWSFPAELNLS
jgi:hypothetical protein